MSQQTPTDLRPCPFCGKMTSSKANFCYYCARELDARPEHPVELSRSFKLNRWIVVTIIIVIIALILFLELSH